MVQATPLDHVVALERALMPGGVGTGLLVHVAHLAILGLLGLVGAARQIEKLLLS
jgi:lipooligosaccharide transport system permease protein